MFTRCVLASLSLSGLVSISRAQTHTHLRADDHAPIGVMADHYHEAGEFMFSYRYMSMSMQGNLDGSRSLSPVHSIPRKLELG